MLMFLRKWNFSFRTASRFCATFKFSSTFNRPITAKIGEIYNCVIIILAKEHGTFFPLATSARNHNVQVGFAKTSSPGEEGAEAVRSSTDLGDGHDEGQVEGEDDAREEDDEDGEGGVLKVRQLNLRTEERMTQTVTRAPHPMHYTPHTGPHSLPPLPPHTPGPTPSTPLRTEDTNGHPHPVPPVLPPTHQAPLPAPAPRDKYVIIIIIIIL